MLIGRFTTEVKDAFRRSLDEQTREQKRVRNGLCGRAYTGAVIWAGEGSNKLMDMMI